MNNSEEKIATRKAAMKNAVILGGFALISTGLIAITHLVTKDKIATEIEAALARRLNEIVPTEQYDNDAYHDCALVIDKEFLGSDKPVKIYRMRNRNQPYALFTSSIAPDGYAGKIKFVMGIYQDGRIAGVRVTDHQETPGLGDKIEIEKSPWIKQFDGKSLINTVAADWRVKKDGGEFDAMTGATITPRAIVKAVYKTLIYFDKNKEQLFSAGKTCKSKQ